jgi:hypothetical protein
MKPPFKPREKDRRTKARAATPRRRLERIEAHEREVKARLEKARRVTE